YWSARVYEIPNSKHQITNKSQITISNDQNRFGIFSHSSRLPQDRNIFGQLNRPGLSEVLRDTIKSYVFWSSWWVGWFRITGPATAFLIVRMKEID
ncbi:MAG: hypothetical protein DRG34_05360, partial [Deltaproteobacteria bacterium]